MPLSVSPLPKRGQPSYSECQSLFLGTRAPLLLRLVAFSKIVISLLWYYLFNVCLLQWTVGAMRAEQWRPVLFSNT